MTADDPTATHADAEPRIVSLHWERVQLVARLRMGTPRSSSMSGFRLERRGGRGSSGAAMPPTRAWVEGDELILRFNVMQGPGQDPLAAGDWALVAEADGGGGARAIRFAVSAAVDPARDGQVFADSGWNLRFEPHQTPDGRLVVRVEVTTEDGVGEGRSGARRASAALWRAARWIRRRSFQALFAGIRSVRRSKGRRVLFMSDSSAELEGNLRLVHDRMVERGLDRDMRLDTILRSSVTARRGLIDAVRLPWLLGRADVIVLADYAPIVYRLDTAAHVVIVQLWHASGAFKTVGYSRIGKAGGPGPWSRIHKNYTHATVSSEGDVPFYAEAFGIPESRVVPTGLPRMDRYFDDAAGAAGRRAAHDAYPLTEGRFTILFAPTFRGEGPRDAFYDMDWIDLPAWHALAVERDAVVIIRMHPFVRKPIDIPPAYRDRIIDGSTAPIDVNDLLFAVDLLITDYSSIVFEFSTLRRPMLFFAPDLDDYIASRDFYVPYPEFVPGRIVRTSAELLDAIRRDDYREDLVATFASRHFAHLDGGATDRVIDEIIVGR